MILKSSFAGDKWSIAKIIMAILAFSFAIYLIYIGCQYMGAINDEQIIKITAENYSATPQKLAQSSFIGAVTMFVATFFLMKKNVKEFIYSIRVSKGKIVPEKHVNPEKELEAEEIFAGGLNNEGNFYVDGKYRQYEAESSEKLDMYEGGLNENKNFYVEITEDDNEKISRPLKKIKTYESGVNSNGNFYVDQNIGEQNNGSAKNINTYKGGTNKNGYFFVNSEKQKNNNESSGLGMY